MRPRFFILFGSICLLAVFFFVGRRGNAEMKRPRHIEARKAVTATHTNATVLRVIDGDTILVRLDSDPEDRHIRLLGVNAPETVDPRRRVECFGKEASQRLRELVEGQRVRLDADLQADERDKYDRLLRNVIREDSTDVNAKMVRDGYAYAYLSFPLNPQRKRELKKLEQNARQRRQGLWDPGTCNGYK